MAYPNNKNNSGRSWDHPPRPKQTAKEFPADYVDEAEKIMQENYKKITTSKLRNLLSLLMDVYNTETLRTEETISEESAVKLQMARIRMAYECGRDRNVKEFVEAAHMMPWLKDIGKSREKAIRYVHYLEAIVAYHRFFGGREN